MSVLVQVASHSGHVTGQVYTKVLFTVCYRSKFCLELSKFLLSFVYILKSLGIGLFSLVMSLCVFFYFWSGPGSCGHMKCPPSKSSRIRCPWSSLVQCLVVL